MNPVVHFEIPYLDAERASAFYRDAFGWRTTPLGEAFGQDVLVITAEHDIVPEAPSGAINGGLYRARGARRHPAIVIGVEDLAATLLRVTAAGGAVLDDTIDIPDVGRYASFVDTEGNRGALLQPSAD